MKNIITDIIKIYSLIDGKTIHKNILTAINNVKNVINNTIFFFL